MIKKEIPHVTALTNKMKSIYTIEKKKNLEV